MDFFDMQSQSDAWGYFGYLGLSSHIQFLAAEFDLRHRKKTHRSLGISGCRLDSYEVSITHYYTGKTKITKALYFFRFLQ